MNKKSDVCHDCIHAEVDCVTRLKKCKKVTPINLVVFRTNNKGDSLMMSKPCENCLRTIESTLKYKNYKLKKIYYTDHEGNIVTL